MVEAQIAHVIGLLTELRNRGAAIAEVRPEVQDRFNRAIQRRSRNSVWTDGGCTSYYIDEQGRNRAIWPDFTWRYWGRARRLRPDHYIMSPAPAVASESRMKVAA
jgi:hypothetical protein